MDLCVFDQCNNHCLMCTNPDRPWPAWDGSFDYSLDAIIGRLEKDKARFEQSDSIYLTGGEPTLHPDFIAILQYLKNNFPGQRIKLLTNGRCFYYGGLAEKVLAVNDNFDIELSLYGPNSEIHDRLTGAAGSFRQTTAGLANVLRRKNKQQTIGVRVILTKYSYEHLRNILEFLLISYSNIDKVIVIFHELEERAVKNISKVKISYSELLPYMKKAAPLFGRFKDIRLYHFPLCTVDAELWPYVWRTLPESEVDFLPACAECACRQVCSGVHKGYLENVGAGEFKPLTKTIKYSPGNNFHKPISSVCS